MATFNAQAILSFLGLEGTDESSPSNEPINFLSKYLLQLPPHLLVTFSPITSPKERTTIPAIRNRRLEYVRSKPEELAFSSARQLWPTLWLGRERRGVEEGNEEKQWAENNFLQGTEKHVKKLGSLLGQYEEEREGQRVREIRREQAVAEEFVPEEDEDSDESDDEPAASGQPEVEESEAELKAAFERRIQERFIYGLLDHVDYDRVDWNENLDRDLDRDMEEKWFDDEED
ncbi:hypothetical protein Moror_8078 [Moniliophthora roreri MCA 2997]|uniref:CCD97-like C-terminal domain-containing protein n=1 Tax=Moniliophthora roreri (strain MCA 2997) TaxID=1381753 RepID=V2XPF0_MONRO|nr:hypothetical protein Moror_8078 [Moniliophthora roreri MCA 2997]